MVNYHHERIDIFQMLRKISEVSEQEAQAAAETITNTDDVVTKSGLKTAIAELETKLTNRIYTVAGITTASIGLMIKFL